MINSFKNYILCSFLLAHAICITALNLSSSVEELASQLRFLWIFMDLLLEVHDIVYIGAVH